MESEGNPFPWPHAPTHQLQESGTYFVTAGTLGKAHYFGSRRRLRFLHAELLQTAHRYGWKLEAWAVFSNHYHFVAHTPPHADDANSLRSVLRELHSRTATAINQLDEQPGRQVWHNYWETHLSHLRSYYARLQYVHQNPVKHGLVQVAAAYPWCSARWIETNASAAQLRTLRSIKIDKVKVLDDYDVWRGDA